MIFIQLTSPSDQKIFVNADKIVTMCRFVNTNITLFDRMHEDDFIIVKESPEEIMKLIKEEVQALTRYKWK